MRFSCVFLCLLLITSFAHAKEASIVIEAQSGTILSAENIHNQFYPASMTKLMTLYLTFEALTDRRLTLGQKLKVSKKASKQPSSKLWMEPGTTITVKEAIQALIIRSANDVAVVLAESIAGSEQNFAQQMTQKAIKLGMYKTRFANANGLHDDKQVSTPRDIALLVRAMMLQFPQYYGYFGQTEFTFRGNKITSHNKFVKTYPGADGLKTGYVGKSGYNLAASAVQGNVRLIGVVFGGETAPKRDNKMVNLMDAGFGKARKLIANSQPPKPRKKLSKRSQADLVLANTGYNRGINGITPTPKPAQNPQF